MNQTAQPTTPNHQPTPTTSPTPVITQPEPEKDLYTWQAPSRPFKKRNREFYTTIGALVILLSVILLFAKEFLLIGVILSFGFVAYVLASVAPEDVKHTLTNKGVRSAKKLYLWSELGRFWWDDKWKQKILHIETKDAFPGRIQLLLGKGNEKKINDIISKYLIKEKPEPTWLDKSSKWLQEKIPLENE